MSEILHAAILFVAFTCGIGGFYFIGKSVGYREARDDYLPLLIEEGRASAQQLDYACSMLGAKSSFCERQREWESELIEMGIDVPEWREPHEGDR